MTQQHSYQVEPHHADGREVRVVVGREGNTMPGVVWHAIAAEDRDYRLIVILSNGREVFGAAPECVLPASAVSA